MQYKLPHTIENHLGEKIIFHKIEKTAEGDKLIVESFCEPGAGPVSHTHFKQDECLTVVSGKIGYQILGEHPKYAGPGESILFKRGVPHKFWAAGNEKLHLKGWIAPANSIVYFLSSIYAAQNKSGKEKPEDFDGAYLLTRYAKEYDMNELTVFVKKAIIPITYFIGKTLGKYKHFTGAPVPLSSIDSFKCSRMFYQQ
jgi:quercetin dioxygenase-like cupin family protein